MKLNKKQIKEYVDNQLKNKIYNLSVSRDGTTHTFKEDSMSTKIWTDAQEKVINQMQEDIRVLKLDVAELKQDVAVLKQDVAYLKVAVNTIMDRLDLITNHLGIK